jgi:hypothetical protein
MKKIPFIVCLFIGLFLFARVAKCQETPSLSEQMKASLFENAFRQQTLARAQEKLKVQYANNQQQQENLQAEWVALTSKYLRELKLSPKDYKIDFDSDGKLVVSKLPVQDSPAPTK